jgi:O-antigen/teichoic acid export membrane protein
MIRRLFKALHAAAFGQIIGRLGSLFLVPLFLVRWSTAMYGEWLAMFAVVGYLSMLDIGMQFAAVNRLTQAYARADESSYRLYQHSALAFYLSLSGAGTIALLAALRFAAIPAWIGLPPQHWQVARWVIGLLGIYVLWSIPSRLIFCTYQTMGNYAKSQWINNAQQLLWFALAAAILWNGGGMISLALLQVLLPACLLLWVLWDLRRRSPGLLPGVSGARWSLMAELLKPSLMFAVITFSVVIWYQGSILLISASLGVVFVALFSVTRTVSALIRQCVDVFGVSLWPDLATMEIRGELKKLSEVHRLLVIVPTVMGAAMAATFWYEGESIITFWTRGRIQPDLVLLRLLLAYAIFQVPWLASANLQGATNRNRRLAWSYLASSVIGMSLAALLLGRFGARAVPIGFMLGEFLCCYHFVIKESCRIVGQSYKTFAGELWLGFTTICAAVLATGWAAHHLLSGLMVARWAFVIVTTSLASTASAWFLWLKPEDRKLILARVRPYLLARLKKPSAVSAS